MLLLLFYGIEQNCSTDLGASCAEKKPMSDILELARRLGKAIAESSQAASLRAARTALDAQPEVRQLLKDFQGQSAKIMRMEEEQKPVEVEDKHRLEELQNKLASHEAFKKYTAAQVEYVHLMRQVNGALQKQLTETEKQG